jgi:hypothetical protein
MCARVVRCAWCAHDCHIAYVAFQLLLTVAQAIVDDARLVRLVVDAVQRFGSAMFLSKKF